MVLNSIGIVTALNPTLGYENSSRIAKRALKENRSVYDLVLEEGLLTKDELDQMLKRNIHSLENDLGIYSDEITEIVDKNAIIVRRMKENQANGNADKKRPKKRRI